EYVGSNEHFIKEHIIMLDKQTNKAGIIKHREITLDENGKASENWKITGLTLKGILNQRVTIPPARQSHDKKSGSAETVMKHYVNKHFVKPTDWKRRIDNIVIDSDKNIVNIVNRELRFK